DDEILPQDDDVRDDKGDMRSEMIAKARRKDRRPVENARHDEGETERRKISRIQPKHAIEIEFPDPVFALQIDLIEDHRHVEPGDQKKDDDGFLGMHQQIAEKPIIEMTEKNR